jgi:REP element-mobilizing transposase RayT
MKYNPAIHHRRSIRLKGYDYASPGAYFVTICTQYREYFFGDIHHGAMKLTPYGEIAQTQWYAIGVRFPNVTTGEYVTMPNHVHGIIYIHPRESVEPAVVHVCATHHPRGGENGNIGQYGRRL